MKTLKQLIKQAKKEFDKKEKTGWWETYLSTKDCVYLESGELKDFLEQQMTKAAKEAIKAVKGEERSFNRDVFQALDGTGTKYYDVKEQQQKAKQFLNE